MTRIYFLYRYWTDQYGNRYTPVYQFNNAYKDWQVLYSASMKCEVIPENYYKELTPWTIRMDRVWYLDIDETALTNAWYTITDAEDLLKQIWTSFFMQVVPLTDIDNFVSTYINLTVETSWKYFIREEIVENPTQEQIDEWTNNPNIEYTNNWNWTYTVRFYININL